MSRRKRGTAPARQPDRPPQRPGAGPGLLGQVAILVAVVAVVTLVAEVAGAANLGVALSLGTIAFTVVLMYLILKR